jgi:hypothetical protein
MPMTIYTNSSQRGAPLGGGGKGAAWQQIQIQFFLNGRRNFAHHWAGWPYRTLIFLRYTRLLRQCRTARPSGAQSLDVAARQTAEG